MKREHMLQLIMFLLLVLSAFFPPRSYLVFGREVDTITDVNIDGDIHENAPVYTRDAASNDIHVYYNTDYRGFIEWNVSSIPDTATIDSVSIRVRRQTSGGPTYYRSMECQPSIQPDNAAGNQKIYDDAFNGTLYYTSGTEAVDVYYTYDLGAIAVNNLQAALAVDWFAVGLYASPGVADYYSSETEYDPELLVEWHLATDYHYQVTGTYYENGTIATPSDVTVSDAFSETFSADGETHQYYTSEPALFSWDIGGGYARTIFTYQEENFTVFLPEDSFYPYSFTIKSYVGKEAEYLEAYRIVNGTQYLIERARVYESNPSVLNLVIRKTYLLKVVWNDTTRFTWGYYVPSSLTEITIVAREVEFSEQAQIIYNHITVEASRTGGTLITVDYEDDRDRTTWANVTIRVRNGAIATTQSYNNASYTFNWAAANASLGYVVTVEGEHLDYGVWGYSKILDEEETFDDPPDLTDIFDFGLGGNIGSWMLVMATVVGFSVRFRARGLLAGMVVASLLNYIGFSSWTYYQIVFGWFIAIMVAMLGGGE